MGIIIKQEILKKCNMVHQLHQEVQEIHFTGDISKI